MSQFIITWSVQVIHLNEMTSDPNVSCPTCTVYLVVLANCIMLYLYYYVSCPTCTVYHALHLLLCVLPYVYLVSCPTCPDFFSNKMLNIQTSTGRSQRSHEASPSSSATRWCFLVRSLARRRRSCAGTRTIASWTHPPLSAPATTTSTSTTSSRSRVSAPSTSPRTTVRRRTKTESGSVPSLSWQGTCLLVNNGGLFVSGVFITILEVFSF